MFETIVVAVDGSAHASRAAETAVDLAARYGARLVVTHVVTGGPVPEPLLHMARVEHLVDEPAGEPDAAADVSGLLGTRQARNLEQLERLHYAIGEHLTGLVERAAREAGVEAVSTDVVEGEPVAGILGCIERHEADAVVVGSRGLSEIRGLLLGSVSHKVCQLAPCTCVTVK